MGDPKKSRKTYETPKKLWDKTRILEEKDISTKYGLRNKKEIWKIKSKLRILRQNARKLLALPDERRLKRQEELMERLYNMGLLEKKASLDNVLTLSVESMAERRLETIVWRKNLANTPIQSRQFITHGHIAINGQKITAPGHIVTRKEEDKITYYKKPLQIKPKPNKKELKKKFEEAKGPEIKKEEKKETEKKEVKKEKTKEKKSNGEQK